MWSRAWETSGSYVEWPLGGGRWADSRVITRQAVECLERARVKRPVLRIRPQEMDVVRSELLELGSDDEWPALSPIWTIVAVEPLVLVEGPGTIEYWDGMWHIAGPRFGGSVAISEAQKRPHGLPTARVILTDGFAYGLTVPFSPEARWFSPTAGRGVHNAIVVND